jgi:PiT family inorganic phosphate transporter
VLLFVALLIALGFEFVNGFHDTANAVATVIYTNAMPAHAAVVWSGFFNFLGVLLSSGAVAFGIVSLLPVELILKVGSNAGFAMVFALLIAAIVWNLATWWFGLPSSSSHTLIGSIIGVGVANALLHGKSGTSGVDWGKATEIGQALLLSPLIGFGVAALLLLAMKVLVRNRALYAEPKDGVPPPWWIRGLLIFTCTGVSFAHGSNDGQKGMGLIMLILIGTVPTAYALNRAVPDRYMAEFHANTVAAAGVLGAPAAAGTTPAQAREAITRYIADRKFTPATLPALGVLIRDVDTQVSEYGSLAKVPAAAVGNIRNDMYLASEAIRWLGKDKKAALPEASAKALSAYKGSLDAGTRFIPTWVKVAVAGAGAGHHGRLEAHRGDGGRKDRQIAPDLCAGRLGRTRGHGHDRRRGHAGPAGFDHARPLLRRGGHDGGQPVGPADGHDPQPADGLGADAAGLDPALGRALPAVPRARRIARRRGEKPRATFGFRTVRRPFPRSSPRARGRCPDRARRNARLRTPG